MSAYPRKGCILLFFFLWSPIVSAVADFPRCFEEVISCAGNSTECTLEISSTLALSVLRTSQGQYVTSPDEATALSHTGCTAYCGTDQKSSKWTFFSHEYAMSLLPYLALVSQLPFGAHSTVDNLMSAILTLGSPTLAGYSLFMTLLNSQWINCQLFSGISDHPNAALRKSVVHVLSGLQQFRFHIHPEKPVQSRSLVVYSHNEAWWKIFANELDCSHGWSIASSTSIIWVVIVYMITVSTAISSVSVNKDSNGLGISSVLLWLLPIVMGWLVLLPRCDHTRVHHAYQKANKRVYGADLDAVAVPTPITESTPGLTIAPSEEQLRASHITSPDELRTPPIFNYARIFSWYRNVHLMSLSYLAAYDRTGTNDKFTPGNRPNDVLEVSHLRTFHQVADYRRPNDREPVPDALWPRGLSFNMIVASLMSLQLQWGTSGAAFLIAWFTPTTGLGCRSLVYLIYGTISTSVWALLVASSALGYYAHHLIDEEPTCYLQTPTRRDLLCILSSYAKCALRANSTGKDLAAPIAHAEEVSLGDKLSTCVKCRTDRTYVRTLSRIADRLRWIGKGLAIINAIGIIANSVLQYTGAYSSCYCNSNVWTWSTMAFNVVDPNASDVELTKKAWIGAVALALSCCSFFVVSVYFVRSRLRFDLANCSTHHDA